MEWHGKELKQAHSLVSGGEAGCDDCKVRFVVPATSLQHGSRSTPEWQGDPSGGFVDHGCFHGIVSLGR